MSKRIEFEGKVHEFPDDFTDSDIAKALGGAAAPVAAKSPWPRVAKKYLDQLPMVGGGVGGAAGTIVGGGTTAGLAAVPSAILGAGLGGVAGQGLREAGYAALGERPGQPEQWANAPEIVQFAGRLAGAGNEQMIGQAAGEALGAGIGLAAKPLMRRALRPTMKMLQEFSDVDMPAEALRRRIAAPAEATAARVESARGARKLVASASRAMEPVTSERVVPDVPKNIADAASMFSRGAEAKAVIHRAAEAAGYTDDELLKIVRQKNLNPADAADAFRRGLDAKALAALREAASNLHPEKVVRVVTGGRRALEYGAEKFTMSSRVSALKRELSNSGEPDEALNEVGNYLDSFTKQHANRRSPIAWYRLAQRLQRESRPFYGRQAQGTSQAVASSPNVMAVKAQLAGAIKEALGADVKGLTAQDANTRVLIALERAFKRSHTILNAGRGVAVPALVGDILARSSGHAGLAEVPATLAAAYVGHAATSPAVLGRAALSATHPVTQGAARQIPRALMMGWRGTSVDPDVQAILDSMGYADTLATQGGRR